VDVVDFLLIAGAEMSVAPRRMNVELATPFDGRDHDGVEVGASAFEVHARGSLTIGGGDVSAHESGSAKRREFTDGDTVARHDVRLALTHAAHDLAGLAA
jgi:hypothetical protein